MGAAGVAVHFGPCLFRFFAGFCRLLSDDSASEGSAKSLTLFPVSASFAAASFGGGDRLSFLKGLFLWYPLSICSPSPPPPSWPREERSNCTNAPGLLRR